VTKSLRGAAATALRNAYNHAASATIESPGYVARIEDNLLPGIDRELFVADFDGAGGSELKVRKDGHPPKFCAVHSSAALAVNTFALWKSHSGEFGIFGATEFESLRFERPCENGFGTPPTLDVLLTGPRHMVGVESKCLEYFDDHTATFSQVYDLEGDHSENDERRGSAWFRELKSLRSAPQKYVRLDAAQLIKHYMGLAHTFPSTTPPRRAILGYVFWEPENWSEIGACLQHREELGAFSEAVAGDRVAFRWISYLDLWTTWKQLAGPAWLAGHVDALRRRYVTKVPVTLRA